MKAASPDERNLNDRPIPEPESGNMTVCARANEHDDATTPRVAGARTTFGEPTSSAETLADRREFLTSGLRPITCAACGTRVFVKKNSPQHTSIQWTTEAANSCPVFAERTSTSERPPVLTTCERLTETIEQAVRDGLVEVPHE